MDNTENKVVETQIAEMNPKKKKKVKPWMIVTALSAMFFVVLFGILINSMRGIQTGIPVTVTQALKGSITQTIDTSGTVESEESKTYFAQVGAELATVSVKPGQIVHKGDVLISYDTVELEKTIAQTELDAKISEYGAESAVIGIEHAQKKAAEAATNYEDAVKYVAHYTECVGQLNDQLAKASKLQEQVAALQAEVETLTKAVEADETDKKSAKALKEKQKEYKKAAKELAAYDVEGLRNGLEVCSSDLAEYKALKEQYEASKEADPTASVNKAQQAAVKESAELTKKSAQEKLEIAKAGVVAEFDGIVTSVSAIEGQTTMEGAELLTVQNSKALKVALFVSKYDLEKLAVGQLARITISGKEYDGEVSNISKVASTNNSGAIVIGTDVHITNPDDAIILGIEGKVLIETAEEKDALLVPISCVNYASDGVFCYVVVDNKIEKRSVETGISNDEYIQILSGLAQGDSVITDVTGTMEEGMAVTPINAQTDEAVDLAESTETTETEETEENTEEADETTPSDTTETE